MPFLDPDKTDDSSFNVLESDYRSDRNRTRESHSVDRSASHSSTAAAVRNAQVEDISSFISEGGTVADIAVLDTALSVDSWLVRFLRRRIQSNTSHQLSEPLANP